MHYKQLSFIFFLSALLPAQNSFSVSLEIKAIACSLVTGYGAYTLATQPIFSRSSYFKLDNAIKSKDGQQVISLCSQRDIARGLDTVLTLALRPEYCDKEIVKTLLEEGFKVTQDHINQTTDNEIRELLVTKLRIDTLRFKEKVKTIFGALALYGGLFSLIGMIFHSIHPPKPIDFASLIIEEIQRARNQEIAETHLAMWALPS